MAGRKRREGREHSPRGSGVDPESGEWSPAFEGQRPPFAAGNTAHLMHGLDSARVVAERAHAIEARLRSSADVPWLGHPLVADIVRDLAETTARAELLAEWLDAHGEMDADAEDRYAERLTRLHGRAGRLMARLGLTPLAVVRSRPDDDWRVAAAAVGADPVADLAASFTEVA